MLLAYDWLIVAQVRVNAVAPGSSIFSSTAAANYGEELAPFELAKPGVPAKRLGTTFEVQWPWVVQVLHNIPVLLLLEGVHIVSLNFTIKCQLNMTRLSRSGEGGCGELEPEPLRGVGGGRGQGQRGGPRGGGLPHSQGQL